MQLREAGRNTDVSGALWVDELCTYRRVGEGTNSQAIMSQNRDWLDHANFAALVAAFFAAGVAAWQSWRLANETVDAIAHTDAASEKQHQDTLAALKIASDANSLSKETAEHQASDTANALSLSKQAADAAARAVETNVASERARLFFVNPSFIKSNDKDPKPKLSFQIVNLGKTSALLTDITFQCRLVRESDGYPTGMFYEIKYTHPTTNVIGQNSVWTLPDEQECLLEKPLSDDDFGDLSAHTALVALTGYIKYQDIFGQKFRKYFSVYTFGKNNVFYPAALKALNEEVKDDLSTLP